MVEPCQFLEWDTHFFGCRVARVVGHRLDEARLKSIERWCKLHDIDVLYFLADSNDAKTVEIAEDAGFHLVDIRVTLGISISEFSLIQTRTIPPTKAIVRPALPSDVPSLQKIAKGIYMDSRFYYDAKLSVHAESLYETWIKRSCEGYADVVLVAEVGGECAGYISAHLGQVPNGNIGLVGVSNNKHGLGLGWILIRHCLEWFATHGVNHVTVVTQGRNVRALQFYERCGFLVDSVQLWYHRWFDASPLDEIGRSNNG